MQQMEARLKKIYEIFFGILVKRGKIDQLLKEKKQYDNNQLRLKQLNDLGVIDDLDGGYNLSGLGRRYSTKWIDQKKKAIITLK
jgi:hypothetical protein